MIIQVGALLLVMISFSEWRQLPEHPGSWYGDSLVVVDFEGSFRGSVVEAGIVMMNGKGEVSAWSGLFSPLAPVTWEETQTHGLKNRDLEGKPHFHGCFDAFREFRQGGILAAHHASVENRFIGDAWPMPGWVPDLIHPGQQISSWGPWLDSRLLAERVFPGMPDYRLQTLIRNLGIQEVLDQWASRMCPPQRRNYHCALYDALASWLLLLVMAKKADWKAWPLDRLLRLQQTPVEAAGASQLGLFD